MWLYIEQSQVICTDTLQSHTIYLFKVNGKYTPKAIKECMYDKKFLCYIKPISIEKMGSVFFHNSTIYMYISSTLTSINTVPTRGKKTKVQKYWPHCRNHFTLQYIEILYPGK